MAVIIMTDDPGFFLEVERTFLHRDGIEMVPVVDGDEALRLGRQQHPDLAILDVEMPPPDGLETCRRFKADPGLSRVPVVLVGAPRDKDLALFAGADGFVPRPVTQASLLAQFRRFVNVPERSTHRLPVGLKVTCKAGEESFVAFTKDISATGLFLKAARPPALGSRLKLAFSLPGERRVEIESEAEVVREVPPDRNSPMVGGVGLRFTSLAADTKVAIGRFVSAGERD